MMIFDTIFCFLEWRKMSKFICSNKKTNIKKLNWNVIKLIYFIIFYSHANFRQNFDRKDHHSWCWAIRLNRNSQGQNPRQIRYPPRSAKTHLRRKTTWRRKKLVWLQHPKIINPSLSLKTQRWCHGSNHRRYC